MPVNLSIKGVPDAIAERLRARAAANRRSLQRELMVIVESAVARPAEVRATRDRSDAEPRAPGGRPIEAILADLHRLFPRARRRGPSAAEIVRRMRDGRVARGASSAPAARTK